MVNRVEDGARETASPETRVCRHPDGGPLDVLLLSMPFAALFRPSIGLSLLRAGLERDGISAETLYLTIPFAELIGTDLYVRLANQEPSPTDLVGEWLFAGSLFEEAADAPRRYLAEILGKRCEQADQESSTAGHAYSSQELLRARSMVGDFLDSCLAGVLRRGPSIVGFSSVFQQQIASLALARLIKEARPEIFIVMGGANCESVMGAEVARRFGFIDAVVSGEGDLVFPEIVRRVLDRKPVDDMQGVYTRGNADRRFAGAQLESAPSVRDLSSLPVPCYDDYFAQLDMHRLDTRYQPRLPIETSRGCWWGQRSHCAFCGLSSRSLLFRSKSPRRALDEMRTLLQRYPGCPISATDAILDMSYFKELMPGLAANRPEVEIFYEVKANLKKQHIRALREAGVTAVQPGVESLSTPVLRLMGKGVSALQNIQLLKWCKEYGVTPSWNMIWGFPGEPPEEYARIAELVPLMVHLQPPQSSGPIRLDRFSPNFEQAESRGFESVRPYPAYAHVYPFDPESIRNLAASFTFEYRDPQDVDGYTKPLREQLGIWQKEHQTSDLFSVDKDSHLLIWDLRPAAKEPYCVVSGLAKRLYTACDRVRSLAQLVEIVRSDGATHASPAYAEKLLQPFLDRGLMVRERESYLSIAIPLGDYSPAAAIVEKFRALIKDLGTSSDEGIVISRSCTEINAA